MRELIVILLIFSPLVILAREPELAPIISKPGELIFSDEFESSEIRKEWVPLHGTQWTVIDGALRGGASTKEFQAKRIAAGNKSHSGRTPSSRLMVPTDDCILQFRFKLAEGLKGVHFGFNDGSFKTGTGHVCRVTMSVKDGVTIQKDENAKVDDDEDETLVKDPFNLKADTWYWMVMEVVGDRLAVQISGGPTLQASHPRIDIPKDQINLPTRGGGVVYYDSVCVWTAVGK